jgi:hypothetical protein
MTLASSQPAPLQSGQRKTGNKTSSLSAAVPAPESPEAAAYRKRAAAIVFSEEAKERKQLAQFLALETHYSVEQARAILRNAPRTAESGQALPPDTIDAAAIYARRAAQVADALGTTTQPSAVGARAQGNGTSKMLSPAEIYARRSRGEM